MREAAQSIVNYARLAAVPEPGAEPAGGQAKARQPETAAAQSSQI